MPINIDITGADMERWIMMLWKSKYGKLSIIVALALIIVVLFCFWPKSQPISLPSQNPTQPLVSQQANSNSSSTVSQTVNINQLATYTWMNEGSLESVPTTFVPSRNQPTPVSAFKTELLFRSNGGIPFVKACLHVTGVVVDHYDFDENELPGYNGSYRSGGSCLYEPQNLVRVSIITLSKPVFFNAELLPQ